VADRVITGLLWVLVSTVVALLAYFILYTISQGLGVLSWDFITSSNAAGNLDGPEVFNTFYILVLALLVCAPIGIFGAVYLVEYARQNAFTAVVRFAAETLAGIPSLVIGLFGFLIFVTDHHHGGLGFGFSRLSAALTLAVLNLPLLIQVSQEALRNVPNELREASAALGATRSQSIFRVLLPSAIPQLATGIILTAGKMIGETAAIIFTSGASSPSTGWQTLDPRFPGDTLTVHLYTLQSEGIQPDRIRIENGTAALLIICLLLFNLGFRWLAGLLNRRFAGRR
jgi:phosphate transport system permease protein